MPFLVYKRQFNIPYAPSQLYSTSYSRHIVEVAPEVCIWLQGKEHVGQGNINPNCVLVHISYFGKHVFMSQQDFFLKIFTYTLHK